MHSVHPTPKFSVITVTYNAEKVLEDTIQSVIAQTYHHVEYIIVDGASKDGTLSIIDRYRPRIHTVVSEPDKGLYDAMNKGVRMCSGEWVIFMNAGDLFASDDVLQLVFGKKQQWEADIIYGDVVKNGEVKQAPANYYLYHRMIFCHQSVFVRRSCLLDIPFDTRHKLSADLKFFIEQYQRHARFMHIGIPISIFDTSGVSNSQRSKGLYDNIRVVCETIPYPQRIRFVMRLLVPYIICKLRGK